MAIGIRHLAELSRQAFSSIWVARPLSAMKTALPYMRAAAIAGDSAPMRVSDKSVPVLLTHRPAAGVHAHPKHHRDHCDDESGWNHNIEQAAPPGLRDAKTEFL